MGCNISKERPKNGVANNTNNAPTPFAQPQPADVTPKPSSEGDLEVSSREPANHPDDNVGAEDSNKNVAANSEGDDDSAGAEDGEVGTSIGDASLNSDLRLNPTAVSTLDAGGLEMAGDGAAIVSPPVCSPCSAGHSPVDVEGATPPTTKGYPYPSPPAAAAGGGSPAFSPSPMGRPPMARPSPREGSGHQHYASPVRHHQQQQRPLRSQSGPFAPNQYDYVPPNGNGAGGSPRYASSSPSADMGSNVSLNSANITHQTAAAGTARNAVAAPRAVASSPSAPSPRVSSSRAASSDLTGPSSPSDHHHDDNDGGEGRASEDCSSCTDSDEGAGRGEGLEGSGGGGVSAMEQSPRFSAAMANAAAAVQAASEAGGGGGGGGGGGVTTPLSMRGASAVGPYHHCISNSSPRAFGCGGVSSPNYYPSRYGVGGGGPAPTPTASLFHQISLGNSGHSASAAFMNDSSRWRSCASRWGGGSSFAASSSVAAAGAFGGSFLGNGNGNNSMMYFASSRAASASASRNGRGGGGGGSAANFQRSRTANSSSAAAFRSATSVSAAARSIKGNSKSNASSFFGDDAGDDDEFAGHQFYSCTTDIGAMSTFFGGGAGAVAVTTIGARECFDGAQPQSRPAESDGKEETAATNVNASSVTATGRGRGVADAPPQLAVFAPTLDGSAAASAKTAAAVGAEGTLSPHVTAGSRSAPGLSPSPSANTNTNASANNVRGDEEVVDLASRSNVHSAAATNASLYIISPQSAPTMTGNAATPDTHADPTYLAEEGGDPLSACDGQLAAMLSGAEIVGYRFRNGGRGGGEGPINGGGASLSADVVKDLSMAQSVAEYNMLRRERRRRQRRKKKGQSTKDDKSAAPSQSRVSSPSCSSSDDDDDADEVESVVIDADDVVLSSESEADEPEEAAAVDSAQPSAASTNALISASSPRSIFYTSSSAAAVAGAGGADACGRGGFEEAAADEEEASAASGLGRGAPMLLHPSSTTATAQQQQRSNNGSPRLRLGGKAVDAIGGESMLLATSAAASIAAIGAASSPPSSPHRRAAAASPAAMTPAALLLASASAATAASPKPQTPVVSLAASDGWAAAEARRLRQAKGHPALMETVASAVALPPKPEPSPSQPKANQQKEKRPLLLPSHYATITPQSVGADPRAFYARAKMLVGMPRSSGGGGGGSQDMAVLRAGVDACSVTRRPEYHLYDPNVDPLLLRAKAEGIAPFDLNNGLSPSSGAAGGGGISDTFVPRSTTKEGSSLADLMRPTSTWDLLHSVPDGMAKVASGDLLYRFCARRVRDLSLEDRAEVASLVNMSGFGDELKENDQPILDLIFNKHSEAPCERSVAACAAAEEKRAKEAQKAAKKGGKKGQGKGSAATATGGGGGWGSGWAGTLGFGGGGGAASGSPAADNGGASPLSSPPSPSEGREAMVAYLKATSAFPPVAGGAAETRTGPPAVDCGDYVVCILRLIGIMPRATSRDGNVDCIMDVDYQRLLAAPDEVFESIDRFRTFRKVKNVIPFVFSFRFQMTGSEVADEETLAEHAHHHDATPSRIITTERTRKNRGTDSTVKSKAWYLHYDIPPRGLSSITGGPLDAEAAAAQEAQLFEAALTKAREAAALKGGKKASAKKGSSSAAEKEKEFLASLPFDTATAAGRKALVDAYLPEVPGGMLVQHTAVIIRSSLPAVLSGMVESIGSKMGRQATNQIFLVRQFLHQRKVEGWDVMANGGDHPHTLPIWERRAAEAGAAE